MAIGRRQRPAVFGAQTEAPSVAPATEATPEVVLPLETEPPLVPPTAGSPVAAAEPNMPARRPEAPRAAPAVAEKTPPAWPIYLVALVVSVLWALAPIAYAFGYRRNIAPLTDDAFGLAVFALLAIGPAVFVWGCAYMIRQGQRLAAESRRAKRLADEMLSPALAAAAQAGDVVKAVRDEIVQAGVAADQARDQLAALRQALAAETKELLEATQGSLRTAQDLAATLGRERGQMGELSQTLDAQAAKVVDAVAQQARMVAEAAASAEDRLLGAEAALAKSLDGQATKVADTVSEQTRRVAEAAADAGDRLLGVEASLAKSLDEQAAKVADTVAEQARKVAEAAADAEDRLLGAEASLAKSLDEQAAKVADTVAEQARKVADAAAEAERELREAEAALSASLEGQAGKIAETITQQARMVADAADVAETQLREAEAVLAARAADLVAAAGEAGDAARTAGEDLVRHIARLETAGTGVADQVRAVEGGLGEQRTALMTLAQALKGDHAAFAAEAEAHAAKLGDFITQARISAAEMSDRAAKGGEALKSLMADAATQFRDLAETARAEREEFGQSTLQSLEAVSGAAAEEREKLEAQTRAAIEGLHAAAEQTREAAERHATTAREQVDQLSEAAFTAGQRANQVFEARLEEARALVEESSKMVEEAGAATARKLEEGAAAARATLTELESMMNHLEQRASRMPANARTQAEEVRATVEHGMEELMAAARRTAEEAQAIDAAFQDRVRRNFEMLSEAVRLMGTVAAAPQASLAASPAPQAPTPAAAPPPVRAARTRPAAPPSEPEPSPLVEAVADEPDLELEDLVEPAPKATKGAPKAEAKAEAKAEPEKARPAMAPLAARLGLRPRLKLTPTATDQEFSQVFEAAGGPPAEAAKPEGEGGGWAWKDLLSSIDNSGQDAESLERALAAELEKMGVEPAKLLPKARIDEIAAAVQVGDLDGARLVVRRLAPAASRRITRRLSTDEALRGQVYGFVHRYQALVDDAVVRDPEGFLMAELLGGDAGRLYLLLDAAAGDMV